MSPDGAWVAYVLTTNDREADEARSAIWMVSWDGSQHLALTAAAEGTSKTRWSPDGRYLAFMATPAGSDKAQIMLLDRRGGDARQLTMSLATSAGMPGRRTASVSRSPWRTGETGSRPSPS